MDLDARIKAELKATLAEAVLEIEGRRLSPSARLEAAVRACREAIEAYRDPDADAATANVLDAMKSVVDEYQNAHRLDRFA
jgi:hypothetical protein